MPADAVLETPSRAELEPRARAPSGRPRAAGLDAALLVESADSTTCRDGPERAAGRPRRRRPAAACPARSRTRPRGERARRRRTADEPARARAGACPPGARTRLRDRAGARRAPGASTCGYAGPVSRSPAGDAMPAVWAARAARARGSSIACARPAPRCSCARGAPCPRRVGRAEADVLSDLAAVMRAHGHEGTVRFRGLNGEFWFGQVLAGPSAAVPGPRDTPLSGTGLSPAQGSGPSRRPLAAGDAVVVDVSGLAGGYVLDQTRTVFLGEPDPRLVSAHETCRAILRPARSCSCPGRPRLAVYDRGLEVAAEAGLEDHYMGFGSARVASSATRSASSSTSPRSRAASGPARRGSGRRGRAEARVPGPRRRRDREQLRRAAGGPERLTPADDDLAVLVEA